MGTIAQMKAAFGSKPVNTYTAATTINISDTESRILINVATGGVTCSKILSTSIIPGRVLTVIGTGANSVTLADNSATTTNGQFDLGGTNRTITAEVGLTFIQLASGAWRMTTHPL